MSIHVHIGIAEADVALPSGNGGGQALIDKVCMQQARRGAKRGGDSSWGGTGTSFEFTSAAGPQ